MTLLESVNGIVIAVAVMSAFVCAPIHAIRHEITSSIDAGGLLHLRKNLTLSNLRDLSREGWKSSLGANLDAPPSKKGQPMMRKRKPRKQKKALVFPKVPLDRGIFNKLMMYTFLGEFGLLTYPNLLIQTNTETRTRRVFALLKELGKGAVGKVFLLVEIPTAKKNTMSGGETSELCMELAGMGLACPAIHENSTNNEISHYCSDLARVGLACYAMKMMRVGSTRAERLSIRNEIGIQVECADTNVVPLVEAWESGNKQFYIMMEYATEGSLFHLVKAHGGALEETQANALFSGILHGVNAMHNQSFAHRDIKMRNVMVTQVGSVLVPKIGDFGLAELVTTKKRDAQRDFDEAVVGTPYYMAPEIVGLSCQDPMKADLWALGVTLYTMLVGSQPFEAKNNMQILYKVGHPGIKDPYDDHFKAEKFKKLTPAAKNFIRKMLNRDPEARITCAKALRDPWLRRRTFLNDW